MNKTESLAIVDAHLNDVGMPTYAELIALLLESQRLGLMFDVGSAYIRRAYIDKQDVLNARIDDLRVRLKDDSLDSLRAHVNDLRDQLNHS